MPLAYYTVSVDGQTQTLEDDSDIVEYSPGLVYGEVLVSTINTCGQESQPATINIPAAGTSATLLYAQKLNSKLNEFLYDCTCYIPWVTQFCYLSLTCLVRVKILIITDIVFYCDCNAFITSFTCRDFVC